MFIPSCPTPHIAAKPGDFAKTVLMPGDPLRARFIAEHYLTDPILVNQVRGVQGYTGWYQNKKVSVMASGMGMPSIGIYSYELYSAFGVENIIRVGSAGGISDRVHVRDLVLAAGACTNSAFAHQYHLDGSFAPIADFELLSSAVAIAKARALPFTVGNILSSDTFYQDNADRPSYDDTIGMWGKMGVLAVEMEAAALYMTAARMGKRALAVCTVSDHLATGEALDALARQESFTDMMQLALELAAQTEEA